MLCYNTWLSAQMQEHWSIHGQYQILTATASWKLGPKFDVFVLQQDSACAICIVMCSKLGLQNFRGV